MMNYREVKNGLLPEEAEKWYRGIKKMDEHAVRLKELGLLPESFASVEKAAEEPVKNPQLDFLRRTVDYVANVDKLTPQLVTAYWRAKLKVDGARAGIDISVPDCNWTEEEIRRPMVDIRGNKVPGLMVPNQFRGEEGLVALSRIYPGAGFKESNSMFDVHDIGAFATWVKVEDTVYAPNRYSSEEDLEDFSKRSGYFGQRVSTYILASQASRDLTGFYFDLGITGSKLTGSKMKGWFIFTDDYTPHFCFSSYGQLLRYSLIMHPDQRANNLGGRFEEVKRT